MTTLKFKEKSLDYIINDMIGVVENSKDEIFHISEEAREEHEQLIQELKNTKEQVIQHIQDGDELEERVRFSRRRLSQVSKEFHKYAESDIREVYEKTHDLQTRLAVLRQDEKVLRERRDDIERRIISLDHMIKRAQGLASKVAVVLNYLNDDFKYVNNMIEEAKEKQEFGLKIIEAQEEERKKISREIHDGPAQMLANILLRSELVDRALRDQGTDMALQEIKSVRKMIRTSLYEVRRIIYDLRPMALDDLGLLPTIKRYISTISDYNDINIEFDSIGKDERLKSQYEIASFRLLQESLQNAIKHANATLIQVKLEITNRNLAMSVKDNGDGFDPKERSESSFGIIGMKERVEMFNGELKIDSTKGKGTRIYINVPYTPNDQVK